MVVTVGERVFSVGFKHSPTLGGIHHFMKYDPKGRAYVRSRDVRGETMCRLVELRRVAACPRHGTAAAQGAACTCERLWHREGFAYCSAKDQYSTRRGRKVAFERVVREAFGSDKPMRAQLWQQLLSRMAV